MDPNIKRNIEQEKKLQQMKRAFKILREAAEELEKEEPEFSDEFIEKMERRRKTREV